MFHFFLLLLFSCLFANSLLAANNVSELAKNPTWLKLLHMDTAQSVSKVSSSSFFISNNRNASAGGELVATLATLDEPLRKNRLPVICKFPARYFWLSSQLDKPSILEDLKHCDKLNHWAANSNEVSLILVSGYLGNPASTFGHALLKLQSSTNNNGNILLDAAINYGAITPEDESALLYVFKGMTGGYKATFLDKYYYTQELMYSRLESRDMWQYTLNLSEHDTKLLIYHIWELIKQEFDYYFLDENCAYQLVDLLELVIDESLVEGDMAWYIPSEGFRRLEEVNLKRRQSGETPLLKSVTFLPSNQRKLNHQLSLLNESELYIMQRIMNANESVDVRYEISKLNEASKVRVLDAALTYYNYQVIKARLKPDEKIKQLKQQILLARFSLPAGTEPLKSVPELESPTQGFAPMLFGLGAGYSTHEKEYLRLHWSGYHQGSTAKNHLSGDELVLMEGELGLGGRQQDIFLEKLDFIRIRKLNNNQMLVRNHDWAWQMSIGLQRVSDIGSRYEGLVSFGAGQTWVLNQSVSLYGMLDTSAHSSFPYIRLRPHLGMYTAFGDWKSLWYVGLENTGKYNTFEQVWGGEIQYFSSNQNAAVLKYEDEGFTKASVEMRWFW